MRGAIEELLVSRLLWSSLAFTVSLLLFWWRRIKRRDAFITNEWFWGILPWPSVAGRALFGVVAFGLAALMNLVLLMLSKMGVDVSSQVV